MELQKIYNDNNGLVRAFAESRIGGRSENQDSFGWRQTKWGYLVTVCDGMGGGPGGKTASSIAVNEILEGVSGCEQGEDISNTIIKAVRRANMAIIEEGNRTPSLRGMGSTATVLLIAENCAYVAHVGDSRVYQLRYRRKVFRTFDHSLVFEMVAQGVITEEQARLSAQSNVITRALGIRPDVEVEIHQVPYQRGDRFVLCTDGIHGAMPEAELVKMMSDKRPKLGVLTDDIATRIDNIGRSLGMVHDNLTIAIVETTKDSIIKPKMTRQSKLIIMVLALLLVMSIVINIVQGCSGHKSEINAVTTDSVTTEQQESVAGTGSTETSASQTVISKTTTESGETTTNPDKTKNK